MRLICNDCTREVSTTCEDCIHYRPKKDYFKAKPKESKELKAKSEKSLVKKGQTYEVMDCTICKHQPSCVEINNMDCEKFEPKAKENVR